MIMLIYLFGILMLLTVVGIILCRIVKIKKSFLIKDGFLLFPGLGLLFSVITVQLFNLLFPVRYFAVPFILFLLAGTWAYRNDILVYLKLFLKDRGFLLLLFIIACIYIIPFPSDSLSSIQAWNNDIMYYLSSMDWLKEHSSMTPVTYGDTSPYFWCAEYMLERTRIGFDGFGAFIMSLFSLEGYEVFSLLGVLFGLIIPIHALYALRTAFYMPKGERLFLILLISLSGRFEELLVYQYIPQICGITCLILFIAFAVNMSEQEDFPPVLTALLIAGTLSIYAEFAAYLFVIYLIIMITVFIKTKSAHSLSRFIKAGLLSIFINPPGFVRAIRINLFVLKNAGEDMNQIDPFAGNVSSLSTAFSQLFGFINSDQLGNKNRMLIMLLLVFCAAVLLITWGIYIKIMIDNKKPYILCFIIFFILYEFYFRLISYGYGEYKHLISITSVTILLHGYLFFQILKSNCMKWFMLPATVFFSVFLLFSGAVHIGQFYIKEELYYFDRNLAELEEAGRMVDAREPIGISGSPASIHGLVYGLRDRQVKILANNISYFPFTKEAAGKYRIYEAEPNQRIASVNEEILWDNSRFYLVKNTGLQSCFYGGFHKQEQEKQDYFRYTCSKESSIFIYNFSEEIKYFSAMFHTQNEWENTELTIMCEGKIIAKGKRGDFLMTDPLVLFPNEKIQIYIYDEGELHVQEGREIGFKLSNYSLVEYEKEEIKKYVQNNQ